MNFTFPLYVCLIPAAIATIVFCLGMILWRRKVKAAAIIVMVIGGAFGVVFGPMLFMDRVTVDAEGVRQRTGFWFSPTRKGITFEESTWKMPGRRGERFRDFDVY